MIIDDDTPNSRLQSCALRQAQGTLRQAQGTLRRAQGTLPPAPPRPASRARRMAPDRSDTCSLVMMLDTWVRTVFGLTPRRRATPALSRPAASNPRTSV